MSQRKKKPEQSQKPASGRAEPREAFHLSQDLLDALQAYVAKTKPATSKSAVIRLALEEFLSREGMWNPPADAPAEGEGG